MSLNQDLIFMQDVFRNTLLQDIFFDTISRIIFDLFVGIHEIRLIN